MSPRWRRKRDGAMPDDATHEREAQEREARGDDPRAAEAGETRADDPGAGKPRADETPLERAERERAEYLVQWQRARADYQNLKRRTYDDIQGAIRRERTSLLEETLMVLDYLDMALAAPCESQEARNLQVGVQMTRDQLWSMFEREGVSPIATDGPFDPELHQAVSTVPTEEREPGAIVEVVRRGFKLGDGVLRFAQVKVASAPESAEPREAPEAPPEATKRPGDDADEAREENA